jgi:hypothetical protein
MACHGSRSTSYLVYLVNDVPPPGAWRGTEVDEEGLKAADNKTFQSLIDINCSSI